MLHIVGYSVSWLERWCLLSTAVRDSFLSLPLSIFLVQSRISLAVNSDKSRVGRVCVAQTSPCFRFQCLLRPWYFNRGRILSRLPSKLEFGTSVCNFSEGLGSKWTCTVSCRVEMPCKLWPLAGSALCEQIRCLVLMKRMACDVNKRLCCVCRLYR